MSNFGCREGDPCNRVNADRSICDGAMYRPDEVVGCYCFRVAPCSPCVDQLNHCDKCNSTTEDDQ